MSGASASGWSAWPNDRSDCRGVDQLDGGGCPFRDTDGRFPLPGEDPQVLTRYQSLDIHQLMNTVALVTGATRNLGLALVQGLAQRLDAGDVVYLTGRDPARGSNALAP